MTSRPILLIQPATSYDDLPALCAHRGDERQWFAQACGLSLDAFMPVRVWQDEALPDPRAVSATIITGAIDMVTDGHAWIARTAQWVREAVACASPVLGVCFGHQLLAHALGGEVGDNPRGACFGEVAIHRSGADDPLFAALPDPTRMMVFHWQSVLRLPQGAQVLAEAAHDPLHAVRFGDAAWGVQFHPEFDAGIMAGSYDVYAGAIERAGFDVAALRAANRDCPDGATLLRAFLGHCRP